MHKKILPLDDLNSYLLKFFNICSLKVLLQLNKYYYHKIINLVYYQNYKKINDLNHFENIKTSKNIKLFLKACFVGNIDAINYYYKFCDKLEMRFAIHIDDQFLFLINCINNNLEVLKWLWEKSILLNRPINTFNIDELDLINHSLIYNNSGSKKFDVNLNDNLLFKIANFYDYNNIFNWLKEIESFI